MKGKQINSLSDLADAALAKRAIIMPDTYFRNRAIPAAWLICMQAMEVHRLMTYGMFIYEKQPVEKFSKAPWNRMTETPPTATAPNNKVCWRCEGKGKTGVLGCTICFNCHGKGCIE